MELDETAWRYLVRRALGIPDVIGEAVAVDVLIDTVYSSPELQGRRSSNPFDGTDERIASAVLAVLVRVADTGGLDRYIMDRPGETLDRLAEEITREAWVEANNNTLPKTLVVPLLEKVKEYVLAHPTNDEIERRVG